MEFIAQKAADLLLIDERRGRLEVKRRGLATTGTLGVLLAGTRNELLDAAAAYQQLAAKTNFRCSPEVQENFLQLVRALDKNSR